MMAAVLSAALAVGALSCPHYAMVPKDPEANLRFRRDILTMAGTDPSAAAQIRTLRAHIDHERMAGRVFRTEIRLPARDLRLLRAKVRNQRGVQDF